VLLVLVECGSANSTEFAARQRRLEHVGSVHSPFGGARANQRVQLVDEKNDLALGLGDFLQNSFEAVFKLAAVLRTSHQCS